jgi:hypothetical protein
VRYGDSSTRRQLSTGWKINFHTLKWRLSFCHRVQAVSEYQPSCYSPSIVHSYAEDIGAGTSASHTSLTCQAAFISSRSASFSAVIPNLGYGYTQGYEPGHLGVRKKTEWWKKARTYIHTHTYTHTHTYKHTYIHTHTYIQTHTYIHTHTHTYIRY